MKQHLVRDVMTPVEKVVRISPYARLRELLKLMREHHVKSVLVDRLGEHDAYGIVTYADILDAIYTQEGDMDLINVYDIATKPMIQANEKSNAIRVNKASERPTCLALAC